MISLVRGLCSLIPKDIIRLNHPVCNHPEFQPPQGKTSIWDGMLYFAGTETADYFGGYLEGALSSAERAVSAALLY